MYIGPWQEYRLAKIQDDAIQRLRHEWEENLRAQLPADTGDNDHRIRELMQPLMAKLPSLLMATKAKDPGVAVPGRAIRRARTAASSRDESRPTSAASTTIATASRRRVERGKSSTTGNSNQETHDADSDRVDDPQVRAHRPRHKSTVKRTKKKGPTAPLTALEEVQRRKKLFATWMKAARNPETDADADGTTQSVSDQEASESSQLPPIRRPAGPHSAASTSTSAFARDDGDDLHVVTRLPPIGPIDAGSSQGQGQDEPTVGSQSPLTQEPDLDDSLDEDAVNQLLNWTDTLLSPSALEASFGDLDVG